MLIPVLRGFSRESDMYIGIPALKKFCRNSLHCLTSGLIIVEAEDNLAYMWIIFQQPEQGVICHRAEGNI